MPSKIWQTLGDALSHLSSRASIQLRVFLFSFRYLNFQSTFPRETCCQLWHRIQSSRPEARDPIILDRMGSVGYFCQCIKKMYGSSPLYFIYNIHRENCGFERSNRSLCCYHILFSFQIVIRLTFFTPNLITDLIQKFVYIAYLSIDPNSIALGSREKPNQ